MKINICKATLKHAPALRRLTANMGRNLEAHYFEECLVREAAGERDFYIGQQEGSEEIAGYVMLVREPRYQPFRRMNIPEIQDLSVSPDLRQQGIGSQLVTFCEDIVQKEGFSMIGLAVGLHARFAPAQRLYLNRGYLPDGNGAIYDCQPMGFAEMKPLDDNFVWKMIREFPAT